MKTTEYEILWKWLLQTDMNFSKNERCDHSITAIYTTLNVFSMMYDAKVLNQDYHVMTPYHDMMKSW